MEVEKRIRTRFTGEEAVQYILEPGSDSELSELDDDDDYTDETTIERAGPSNTVEEDDGQSIEGEEATVNEHPPKEHVFKWRKKEPELPDISFLGSGFTLPEDVDELTPLTYFKQFWDDSITENIVEQTNLYSVQEQGSSVCTTKDEVEVLLGIQMKMGLIKIPKYELYWDSRTRYEPIASAMPLKRYKKLRQFLHVNDNSKKNDPGNKDNRLYKVMPVVEGVRQNCLKIEPEECHSIDEQIIPAKTKYSGIRQYNPKKPTKWGFKNFVRAGKSGLMYDFFIYQGAKSTGQEKCTSESVVLKLCSTLPKHVNHLICFDNWFTTLNLMLELKSLGYPSIGTVRANRMSGCPLQSEKELKKNGRGSFDYRTDSLSQLHIVRWQDNKCVQVASTFAGVKATETVKRWDSKLKKHVNVQCPEMICQYNAGMGGVDFVDMLISLYRTKIKSRRWYLKVLFHCVDIAKVNAWLLYRRHCELKKVPKPKQQPLLDFCLEICESLIKCGKSTQKRKAGRPSNEGSARPEKRGRKPDTPLPFQSTRSDCVHHWPECREAKNRCRHCKKGYSRTYCSKCNVCLCLTGTKNCFSDFHVG